MKRWNLAESFSRPKYILSHDVMENYAQNFPQYLLMQPINIWWLDKDINVDQCACGNVTRPTDGQWLISTCLESCSNLSLHRTRPLTLQFLVHHHICGSRRKNVTFLSRHDVWPFTVLVKNKQLHVFALFLIYNIIH